MGEDQESGNIGAIAKATTVPQMFVNGELVGGSDSVERWLKQRAGARAA